MSMAVLLGLASALFYEEELAALERTQPAKEEQYTARVIRMLPRAAELLRERIGAGNLGLRDPRSIIQACNVLFGMFGGKVPMHPGETSQANGPTSWHAWRAIAMCCWKLRRVVSKVVAEAHYINIRRRRALHRAA